jgi:agmatine/peptidylarginine deiminase
MQKKFTMLTIFVTLFLLGTVFVNGAQIKYKNFETLYYKDKAWFENNPDSLPIWLTSEEMKRLDEIGKHFVQTQDPPGPVRHPAEFEPMEGVLIRYPFGISYQIIAEMSEDVEVVTIVASTSEKNYVLSQYQNHGVNTDNCDFLIAPTNSYWTRDYGPWFIFNGDDEQGIVDHIYNRPRPYDDAIPNAFGNWRGIPVYNLPLEHTGGNYMTDGQGIAVSTDLVWYENPGFTHEQIDQYMEDYCGIETYHVVPDALGEYIEHIDCWAKYLSPDTIMIIETSPSHSHYEDIEEAVSYFENQTSCYGTPYDIKRIYTHLGEPYINSLILNDKVLVPISGSQWDDEAIVSYEDALPGYEVLGFSGSWATTDALHCRTMGITDSEMLYISHIPLSGTQSSPDGYEINATIFPYSGEDVNTAEIFLRIDGGSWNNEDMDYLGSNQYKFVIPSQSSGTVIDYYIHAEDDSGRSQYHPYIGESMAHSFICYLDNDPPEKPEINGPTNGKPNIIYDFEFSAIDPDGDDVKFFINWADGEEEWTEFVPSGSKIVINHSWIEKGLYEITAKAKDVNELEGPVETFEFTINKNKEKNLHNKNLIQHLKTSLFYFYKSYLINFSKIY